MKTLLVVVALALASATLFGSSADLQRRRSLRLNPSALSVIGAAQTCTGTTYYVRTDGLNSHTGLTNTAGGAWLTIGKGLSTAVAGDCVRVQAGNYVEVSSASHNGTSGSPITFVADGVVNACGLSFSANSYLRFIGFNWDPDNTSGCSPTGINQSVVGSGGNQNTGLEFWNDTINSNVNGKGYIFYNFNTSAPGCTKCIFLGGGINSIGGGTVSDTGLALYGDDNFVGYLNFTAICYIGVGPSGLRGRYLNLNFSGLIQCNGAHPDFFYISGNDANDGYSNNVIESTFGIGTNTADQNKFHHMQNQNTTLSWDDNIYRLNVGTQIGSGAYSIYSTGSATDVARVRWYNNTWVLNERAVPTGTACGSGRADTGVETVYLYNELYYQCLGDSQTTNVDGDWGPQSGSGSFTLFHDYNLIFRPSVTLTFLSAWNAQTHKQNNVDPGFVAVGSNDFHLTSGGGARGVGGPLTTANGSGSSSTSLTVATNTGSFFVGDNGSNLTQYSGKLEPGDFLTVGSCTAQVSSVSGDTITLASACTWANADPVYYGSSSTIDIGAYPYKAGGYTLSATKLCAGTTCTITPNDTSLVRFVVCYEAGVPYKVINASPYTCTAPLGTFEARVYPKYASQTQWVVAQ
jgi:hypothetical protein